MKYTQANLDKLQGILGDADYVVRFERGTFQSGWCLLEQKRVVVLNKFLNVEGRINTLLEIIPQLNIEFDKLTHESQKLYETVMKRRAAADAEAEAEDAAAAATAAEAAAIAETDAAVAEGQEATSEVNTAGTETGADTTETTAPALEAQEAAEEASAEQTQEEKE
ncbi:hypothetical protein SAMN05421788_101523 [Filimonas lacunae]|uniref:Uncharacterized protein n=1 Tax=Filimonas lacunae TaxID=477680 RepID=A0A173MN44_9BACT|nr:hypothetical protein [Filimonas lacunae]BAV09075.1 hypothetical protein FLA_5123 [Filimonas lacunae]SIS66927.1 hypothetical protein SAMN05421788_101523 [Filimonas lacunae]